MKRLLIIAVLGFAAAGCAKHEAPDREAPASKPVLRPLPKARPTIDPKSSEAAENLVEGFVRLVNAGRFNDAYMLLGANAPPRAEFDRRFTRYSGLRASSGTAGAQDGAAGSIYVSVPITLSGKVNGEEVRDHGNAVLRRVNDVEGSSEMQRRWHIERIDWDKS